MINKKQQKAVALSIASLHLHQVIYFHAGCTNNQTGIFLFFH